MASDGTNSNMFEFEFDIFEVRPVRSSTFVQYGKVRKVRSSTLMFDELFELQELWKQFIFANILWPKMDILILFFKKIFETCKWQKLEVADKA